MNNTFAIIFSRNRPAQLDLTLKTLKNSVGDLFKIDLYVLYKADNDNFKKGYKICKEENNFANFIEEHSFYDDVKNLLSISFNKYVLFCTDDTIFTHNFTVEEIEKVMNEDNDLLNFSLRLGTNTIYCYPLSAQQQIPDYEDVGRIFKWNWLIADYDFGYPLELSSSVLRVEDIKQFINTRIFTNPNLMEWYLDISKGRFSDRCQSACFKTSVAFSAPMNTVDNKNVNRVANTNNYSVENLLKKYLYGYRINPYKFYKYIPIGAHQEVEFEFIKKGV
jgi:hypothetical protein